MWVSLLNRMLVNIFKSGDLHVTMPAGETYTYGDGSAPSVHLHLLAADLPKRLVHNPELAVGEAYVNGDLTIENDDVYGFMTLGIQNLHGQRAPVWWQRMAPGIKAALRRVQQYNPIGKARLNVSHHYDLSGELYDLFLDVDKQYSCGYFIDPDNSLEQAQIDKKNLIARKLRIEPGMRVLDIGCGWGGLGLTLAQDYGADVVGVTLSTEQHAVAQTRAKQAGLTDKVDFRLLDYRNINGKFDRIVSIGMFEHVGAPHFNEFFRHINELLVPDGVALIHTIGRTTSPANTNPWIAKYIFPGGYVPAMSEVLTAVQDVGLMVSDIEVWRLHYAYTLRHWRNRFEANREKAAALYDERFCRMWTYYLVAAELSFRLGVQDVFQFQLVRQQDAVPLTRDYIYEH